MKHEDDGPRPDAGRIFSNRPCHRFSRRDFLSAVGATAAAALVGAGCDKKNPTKPSGGGDVIPPLPESSTVSLREAASYVRRDLRPVIEQMFTDLGGIEDVVRQKTVGIKINLTGGSGSAATTPPAVEYFWTHPEVLRAVMELIRDAGASKIYVLESLYDWGSYANYGFKAEVDRIGATFVDLNATTPYTAFVQRPVGTGWLIYQNLTQNAVLNDCEAVVSLPKAKQHVGGGVTHGMKNLVGSIPVSAGLYNAGQGHRAGIHQIRKYDGNMDSNLRRVIVDLNLATRIRLTVNDAIKTMANGEGPWNRGTAPVTYNRLIAGKDVVAADAIATRVIGFDPMSADGEGTFGPGISTFGGINYLKLASEKGIGNYDTAKIRVVGITL